ncbi:FAD-dependent monooxygenase [Phanerochaete sordida]|uniref:FAD-dependent monooxygenase n=1 Tax=Phanerochaete sordida TaxID=48140 RepID=A0A9P3GKT9_9APHY|nr:FAD-dependent monooxygenase [Phanerochaete sordida]
MQERPIQARLRIRFVVIGGTPAGLACALALRRAGHDVTVLDVADPHARTRGANGCLVPPSMSKLLLRWLPAERVRALSVRSRALAMTKFEHAQELGTHVWREELFRDAGGDILYMHHADVQGLLRDAAEERGADTRANAQIASVEFGADGRPCVHLASGEAIDADVVVGTDGPESVVRRYVVEHNAPERTRDLSIFSISVPRDAMEKEPDLAPLLAQSTSYSWLGESRGAVGYVAGVRAEYSLQVYVPATSTAALWHTDVTPAQVLAAMGACEPRLRRLVELARAARCVPLTEPRELETWVHTRGRLILIGDAAHPFPRGSTNALAAAVCDAAALGELFRHLHDADQVAPFLHAVEAIRRAPVRELLRMDLACIAEVALPPGAAHARRERRMRAKCDAGTAALVGCEADDKAVALWEQEKAMFAYDAEDHANEWWNDWGLLSDRATNHVCVIPEKVPVCEVVAQSVEVL